jgi:hypothetical protein
MNFKSPKRPAIKAMPTAEDYRSKRFDTAVLKLKNARSERMWAKRDPDGALRNKPSAKGWEGFLNKRKAERAQDIVGANLTQHLTSSGLPPFIYDHGKSAGELLHQVKYGPSAQLNKRSMSALNTHYGADVGPRLSQYSSDNRKYPEAARATGRPLTEQEHDIQKGKDPGSASINHLIASGTGQNLLNRMTMQFHEGQQNVFGSAKSPNGPQDAQKAMMKGFAMQAAAVGRMTGLGRAILAEETPNMGYGRDRVQTLFDKRMLMKRDVLKSFEGKDPTVRHESYKNYMKNTFDSFGNLRLGQGQGNGRVSTGFDMPLTSGGKPTQHGLRLHSALVTYGLPDMLHSASVQNQNYKTGKSTKIRTGVFTVNTGSKILSSSKEK